MKRFIYFLYFVFVVLMVITFYYAFKVHDGLVVDHYYEKSLKYFELKKKEEKLGLRIAILKQPDSRMSEITLSIDTARGPLEGAKVVLVRGAVSNDREDKDFQLIEIKPGVYTAVVKFPRKGKWFLRLKLKHPLIQTERIWQIDIP